MTTMTRILSWLSEPTINEASLGASIRSIVHLVVVVVVVIVVLAIVESFLIWSNH